jgi:hypothetical protein
MRQIVPALRILFTPYNHLIQVDSHAIELLDQTGIGSIPQFRIFQMGCFFSEVNY